MNNNGGYSFGVEGERLDQLYSLGFIINESNQHVLKMYGKDIFCIDILDLVFDTDDVWNKTIENVKIIIRDINLENII